MQLIPRENSPNAASADPHPVRVTREAVFSKGRSTAEFVSFAPAFIPPSLATTETMTVTATASVGRGRPPVCHRILTFFAAKES